MIDFIKKECESELAVQSEEVKDSYYAKMDLEHSRSEE